MISMFHKENLKKRFPKAMKEYQSEERPGTWVDITNWIKERYPETRHYAAGMQRIENGLKTK